MGPAQAANYMMQRARQQGRVDLDGFGDREVVLIYAHGVDESKPRHYLLVVDDVGVAMGSKAKVFPVLEALYAGSHENPSVGVYPENMADQDGDEEVAVDIQYGGHQYVAEYEPTSKNVFVAETGRPGYIGRGRWLERKYIDPHTPIGGSVTGDWKASAEIYKELSAEFRRVFGE